MAFQILQSTGNRRGYSYLQHQLRQEGCKFKASLRVIQKPVSKIKQKKRKGGGGRRTGERWEAEKEGGDGEREEKEEEAEEDKEAAHLPSGALMTSLTEPA